MNETDIAIMKGGGNVEIREKIISNLQLARTTLSKGHKII